MKVKKNKQTQKTNHKAYREIKNWQKYRSELQHQENAAQLDLMRRIWKMDNILKKLGSNYVEKSLQVGVITAYRICISHVRGWQRKTIATEAAREPLGSQQLSWKN